MAVESLTGFASEDDVEETSDQSMSDVDGKKYKSQVWNFLQKSDMFIACNICNAILAYHGSTSSMFVEALEKEISMRKHC